MDNKFKILMGLFLLIILTSSVKADGFWAYNYTYVNNNTNLWVRTSNPYFTFEPAGNRTSWTTGNITANNVMIKSFSNVINGTNYTYSDKTYGDTTNATAIGWYVTLCYLNTCQTSVIKHFGVDANAPNITGYNPVDLAWSKVTNNSFNFTGDDLNNDTAILYLTNNATLMQLNKSDNPKGAGILNSTTIRNWEWNISKLNSGLNNFTRQNLNGTYYWDISINDSANNIKYASGSAATYFTLYVDADNPSITGQPASNFNTTNAYFYPNVTCGDANPNNAILTIDGVNNQTKTYTTGTKVQFNALKLADGLHEYNFTCNDDANNSATSTTYKINVDTTAPVVTINNDNNSWLTSNGTLIINLTLVETNIQDCKTYIGLNNGTVPLFNITNSSTALSLTGEWLYAVTLANTTYPSPYYYNVVCNDTSGNIGNTSYNTVNIDTTTPQGVSLIFFKSSYFNNYTYGDTLRNGSYGTMRVGFPVAWINASIPTNFREYEAIIDDNVGFTSPDCIVYETAFATNWTVFNCTLAPDTTYYYTVNVTNQAGTTNATNVSEYYTYTTISEGAIIYPGYNYYSIIRDDATPHGVLNASDLVTELSGNRTGGVAQDIDLISIYNLTGQFQTYDVDTPTINGNLLLYRGRPVIIYNSGTSNIYWGGNRFFDPINGNVTAYSVNMSNNTNPWHLLGMLNWTGMNFQDIENEMGNGTVGQNRSFYNGVSTKHINMTDSISIPSLSYINYTQTYSYFPGWEEPWNNTKIYYGQTFWIEMGTIFNSVCYNTTSGNPRFC